MIYVVGIGPGNPEGMTFAARAALEKSSLLVGYDTYVNLIRPLFPDKVYSSTPMRQERERCWIALEAGRQQTVALLCSGDAGVYGMASLVLELAGDSPACPIEVVPGVTAACGGGALLGAPLGHDFAVISLSDLLTPWELIERRLEAAGWGDFCICLYNPSSHKRRDYLQRACQVLLKFRSPQTAAGVVRNIGRLGEQAEVTTLQGLCTAETDMFCTVFIGNSQTKRVGNRLVTPRGYQKEASET